MKYLQLPIHKNIPDLQDQFRDECGNIQSHCWRYPKTWWRHWTDHYSWNYNNCLTNDAFSGRFLKGWGQDWPIHQIHKLDKGSIEGSSSIQIAKEKWSILCQSPSVHSIGRNTTASKNHWRVHWIQIGRILTITDIHNSGFCGYGKRVGSPGAWPVAILPVWAPVMRINITRYSSSSVSKDNLT